MFFSLFQMLLFDHLRCVLSSWAKTLGFQNSLNEIKYRDSCVYTMQKWEDWKWGRDKWAILVTYHLKGFTEASLLTVALRIKCKHLLFCINAHCFHILLFCIYILSVISLYSKKRDSSDFVFKLFVCSPCWLGRGTAATSAVKITSCFISGSQLGK